MQVAAALKQLPPRHENQVLQFLLGEAPLMSSALEMKTSALVSVAEPLHTLHANRERDDDGDLLDAPVLEYASDFESEDDYIDSEFVAQEELLPKSESSDWTGSIATATSQDLQTDEAVEQSELAASPSLEEEDPCAVEMTAVEQERTLTSLIIAAGDVKAVDPHSDTTSNCTEDDGGSSDDGEGADGLLSKEVEEEPPECTAEDAVSDVKPSSSRAPEPPVSSSSGGPLASTHRATSIDIAADKAQDHSHKSSSKSVDQSTSEPASSHSERQDSMKPHREVSTTKDEYDDNSDELQQQRSSPESLPKTHPIPAPTISEITLVGLVAMGVALYVLATVYAYYNPIFLPLPPLETLQTPMDFSNLSIVITSPANSSLVEQPLYFEWQLANYPTFAIAKYGPEVFAYRIYVNEKRVISEIGLLNTSSTESSFIDTEVDHKVKTCEPETFNTTTRHRIPAHHLPDYARYELKIEVTLPIPGSDGVVHTMQQRVVVTKAFDVSRRLELLSPKDGAIFPLGEAVVLEYRASNVKKLDVVVDGEWRFEKQHIGDGNLLLRGLGEGQHLIELVGLDASDRRVLSRDGGGGLTTTIIPRLRRFLTNLILGFALNSSSPPFPAFNRPAPPIVRPSRMCLQLHYALAVLAAACGLLGASDRGCASAQTLSFAKTRAHHETSSTSSDVAAVDDSACVYKTSKFSCQPAGFCSFQFKLGDLSFDQSCRVDISKVGMLPQQLHLAYAGESAGTAMTVSWTTYSPVSDPRVWIGASPATLKLSEAPVQITTYYEEDKGKYALYSYHATATKLTPFTKYFYKVGSLSQPDFQSSSSLPTHFTTARAVDTNATFDIAVYGDFGADANAQETLKYVTTKLSDTVDFVYHIGDVSYADNAFLSVSEAIGFFYEETYNRWMNSLASLMQQTPYMVLVGNHEAECHSPVCATSSSKKAALGNYSAFNARFKMPSRESGGVKNMWYAFEYGPVHFTSISSETDYTGAPANSFLGRKYGGFGDQLAWLEADLKKANANRASVPWLIVGMHRAMYTLDKCDEQGVPSGEALPVQRGFEELFIKYNVDVVVAGHVHAYERQYPIARNLAVLDGVSRDAKTYANPKAPVYITSGAAGNTEGHEKLAVASSPWNVVMDAKNYGISKLRVSRNSLTWSFVATATGDVLDEFAIVKN